MAFTPRQWIRLAKTGDKFYIDDLIEEGLLTKEIANLHFNILRSIECGLKGAEPADADIIILMTPRLRSRAVRLCAEALKNMAAGKALKEKKDFENYIVVMEEAVTAMEEVAKMGRAAGQDTDGNASATAVFSGTA